MGVFSVKIGVADDSGLKFEPFDACVDTGASYTWIPRPSLEALGHTPQDERDFVLADGRRIQYGFKEIRVKVNGGSTTTWVVFGEPGTDALLGAVTLQELGLGGRFAQRRADPGAG